MAKLLCVFSTLATAVEYTEYKTGENGVPVALGSVLIKGGAGVANENIQTPRGVATMVTEAQAEALKRNELFKLHAKNGYVAIDTVERAPSADDVENAAAGLTGRDTSAPLVPEDFTANGQKAPAEGKATRRK